MIIEAVGFKHPHVLDKLVEGTEDLLFKDILIFVWKDSQSINTEKKSTPFLVITPINLSSSKEVCIVRDKLKSLGYLVHTLVKQSGSIPTSYA